MTSTANYPASSSAHSPAIFVPTPGAGPSSSPTYPAKSGGMTNGNHLNAVAHPSSLPNGVGSYRAEGNGGSPANEGLRVNGEHEAGGTGWTEEERARNEAQLPVVSEGLVPFGAVIERVIVQAYADLQNLSEELPSKKDQGRKRAIVEYVLRTHRQMMKLLVLARWSGSSVMVQKCMSLVVLLQQQNAKFHAAAEGLESVKEFLSQARVRNYDLSTAIDVLTTGSYQRLPASIEATFASGDKLSDEEVIKTLGRLDRLLRYRLAVEEIIPPLMRDYRISDGRVFFTVPDAFEASLVLGGEGPEDLWYLLHVEFLFTVKGPAEKVFPRRPIGDMREHVLALGNQELARRTGPPAEGQDGPSKETRPAKKDAPLIRVFNFLRNLSLNYQLEALRYQAFQLPTSSWTTNVSIDAKPDQRQIKVSYWTQVHSDAHQFPPRILHPYIITPAQVAESSANLKGSILIEVVDDPPIRGKQSIMRILAQETQADEEPSEAVTSARLVVKWEVAVPGLSHDEIALRVDPKALDLQVLLRRAIDQHSRALLRAYRQRILDYRTNGEVTFTAEQVILVEEGDPSTANEPCATSLRVEMRSRQFIDISINSFSGKLEFRFPGATQSQIETRSKLWAGAANAIRDALPEVLTRIKFSAVVDEFETQAQYLGLQVYRRLPIHPRELAAIFGNTARLNVYVDLGPFPTFYLVGDLTERGWRFALVSVRQILEGHQSWLSITETGWINPRRARGEPRQTDASVSLGLQRPGLGMPILQPQGPITGIAGLDAAIGGLPPLEPAASSPDVYFGFELQVQDLRDLHCYCITRIAYFVVEQQLEARRVQYAWVAPRLRTSPSMAVNPSSSTTSQLAGHSRLLTPAAPCLALPIRGLIQDDLSHVLYSNVSIRVANVVTPNSYKVCIQARLRLRLADTDVESVLQDEPRLQLNKESGVLAFTAHDVRGVIAAFMAPFGRLARLAVMQNHKDRARSASVEGAS